SPGNHDRYPRRHAGTVRRPGADHGRPPVTVRLLVIGVGTGSLDHLTRGAIAALNEVDLFLVADKGSAKRDLAALRVAICEAFIAHDHYQIVEVAAPERDRSAIVYRAAVTDWHAARARAYERVIRDQ